jgi:2-polyprenyl-3-methyl-5-hydroxy-6-metoxy-1,4-benzoquinol methylase
MEPSLYKDYTSTSSMSDEIDEVDAVTTGRKYFVFNFEKLLPTDKGARILDIGCGYGRYLYALMEMGYRNCHGIDISDVQVQYAQRELGLANIEQADAVKWLEGRSEEFDCILAIDLLEHLPNDALLEMGEKMYGALKPGGRIIVQVPNGVSPLNPYVYGDLTHVRAFTAKSMRQFFLHTGFVPAEFREVPPLVVGFKSAVRSIFWHLLIKPLIVWFMYFVNGKKKGDIYSANFIAVAERAIK